MNAVDIDFKEIGERLSRRRKVLGLKQAEVCERCGISDKYLSNIECARSVPSIDVLVRICNVLETTPDAILLGIRRKTTPDIEEEVIASLKRLNDKQLKFVKAFIGLLSEQGYNT